MVLLLLLLLLLASPCPASSDPALDLSDESRDARAPPTPPPTAAAITTTARTMATMMQMRFLSPQMRRSGSGSLPT